MVGIAMKTKKPFQCGGQLCWKALHIQRAKDSTYFTFLLDLKSSGLYSGLYNKSQDKIEGGKANDNYYDFDISQQEGFMSIALVKCVYKGTRLRSD